MALNPAIIPYFSSLSSAKENLALLTRFETALCFRFNDEQSPVPVADRKKKADYFSIVTTVELPVRCHPCLWWAVLDAETSSSADGNCSVHCEIQRRLLHKQKCRKFSHTLDIFAFFGEICTLPPDVRLWTILVYLNSDQHGKYVITMDLKVWISWRMSKFPLSNSCDVLVEVKAASVNKLDVWLVL